MEKIPPWYEQVAADIKKKNNDCFIWNGVGWSSKAPENPYSLQNMQLYSSEMDALHGNKLMACTRTYRNTIPKTTDRLGRYYNAKIRDKNECNLVKGIWDSKAIDRNNKYGKGVCWTTPDQQQCSALTKQENIIPDLRSGILDLKGSIAENKKICDDNQKCKWHDGLEDCIDKSSFVEKPNHDITIEPLDFPKDITSTESKIQNYLYYWYSLDIPSAAPRTDVLEGEGNRCVENSQYKY